jgi:hypothetical protein
MRKRILAAAAAASLAGPIAANATLIDFESLASPGTATTFVGSHAEDGYQLINSSYPVPTAFGSAQTGNASWYAGSTGLFNAYPDARTTLSSLTGGVFDLYSIDLAPVSTVHGPGASVQFVGRLFGGGIVMQSFTVGSPFAFQSFLFSGFENLISVSWRQTHPYHQFDNICIDDASSSCSPTRVPEPGTLALFGFGLAALGVMRRRRVA